jgi:hypothetical protein
MLIEILRDTSIKGVAVKAGQVIDAEQSDATTLINMGKALPAPAVEPEPAPVLLPVRKPRKPRTHGNLSANT